METDKIRDAILKKAKGEADQIIADAKTRATEMIDKAKEQRQDRFEDEKKKRISEARHEASKIMAQSSLKSRQDILREKDTILNTIIEKVTDQLSQTVMDKEHFLSLVHETVEAFETDKQVVIFVSPKDLNTVRRFIEEDSNLKEKISEVKELDCLGGILAQTMDGMVSIDNTYDTRLEMLMPKILPEVGKNLFGVLE
jgi:V/A-type H+-transporting ATPase subunit E